MVLDFNIGNVIFVYNLNQRQAAAVKYIDGPLFVLAGAGSGKTKVITNKITYLIEKCGISANKIVAVTFTNKAAKEMKQRVKSTINNRQTKGLIIATFHTFGLKIIRQNNKHFGLNDNFTIADASDALQIIADLTKKNGIEDKEKIAAILQQISKWKNQLIVPDIAISNAETKLELQQAIIYRDYERILTAYNMLDFDDLICKPVFLFKSNADVLAKWQQRVHYLLIDEYQDTNTAQYKLTNLLIQHSGKLTVVGDDDQSIYSWRGANPQNLTMLQNDYPSLKVIKLEQNYRSTSNILQAANAVIANNSHIYDKKLWSDLGVGEKISFVKYNNEDHEAERVAAEILTHRIRFQNKYRDYAILFRSNFQARLLEIKLQSYNIPYQLTGGISFFARSEIKDIMAYLRLLINPEDDSAFLRIVNTPKREIGPITLAKLSDFAKNAKLNLEESCLAVDLKQHLATGHINKLTAFANWMQQLRRLLADSEDPISIIRQMITESNYEDFIRKQSANTKQAEKRLNNINVLISSLKRSLGNEETDTEIAEDHSEKIIEQAIAGLILKDILERQEEENKDDAVQLLTIHASKGLEFNHVFIIGVEENIIPHKNSIASKDITEERRLFYVGITRARQTLTLLMAAKRKIASEVVASFPSRFVDEIPDDILELDGFTTKDSKQSKQQAAKVGLESLYQTLND